MKKMFKRLMELLLVCCFMFSFSLIIMAEEEVEETISYKNFYMEIANTREILEIDGDYYFTTKSDSVGLYCNVVKFDGDSFEVIHAEEDIFFIFNEIGVDPVSGQLILARCMNEEVFVSRYDGSKWIAIDSWDTGLTSCKTQICVDGDTIIFDMSNYKGQERFQLYLDGNTLKEDTNNEYVCFIPKYATIPRTEAFIGAVKSTKHVKGSDEVVLIFESGDIYSSIDYINWSYKGVESYEDVTYLGNNYYLVANSGDEYFQIAKSLNQYEWTIVGEFIKTCTILDEEYKVMYNQEFRKFISENRYIPTVYDLGFAEMFMLDGIYYISFRYGTGFDGSSGNYLVQSNDLKNWSYVEGFNQPDRYTYKGEVNTSTHFDVPELFDNGLFYDYGSYGFFATSWNLKDWTIHTDMRTASTGNGYKDCYLIGDVYHGIAYAEDGYMIIKTKDFSTFTRENIQLPRDGYFTQSGNEFYYRTDTELYVSTNLINWSRTMTYESLLSYDEFYILEGAKALTLRRRPNTEILIRYNNKRMELEAVPMLVNNRTLIPVRDVTENFGFDVEWDGSVQSITLTKDDKIIVMHIDKRQVTVDGKAMELDVAPGLISNKTYIPLRFISEVLGMDITWDGELRTVIIN